MSCPISSSRITPPPVLQDSVLGNSVLRDADHRDAEVSPAGALGAFSDHHRSGFTLVEILVVIVIIGILAAVAIPAITNGVRRARVTSLRLEVSALEGAIEQYQQKHGDYPPDFSDWNIVQRHYRKVFSRMSTNDTEILYRLLHTSGSDGDITTKADNVFDATSMDRAEALVWTLGGYSTDIQRPFTGPGGPLAWTGDGTDSYASPNVTAPETTADEERQSLANFQINIDRPNAIMEFETQRLDYSTVNAAAAMTGANRRLSSDGDLLLSYAANGDGAPYVYFDSRSYGLFDPNVNLGAGDFNGYASTAFGVVRPYLSDIANSNTTGADYASEAAALAAWQWMNPNKFQIICAGLDSNFGSTASFDVNSDSTAEKIYFQYPTGNAIALRTDVATPAALIVTAVSKYQESAFGNNEQLPADNITNFSGGAVVDDIP